MKSIERNFNQITEKNPRWSSWTCFANAISGQNFTSSMMRRWFYKLVDEYDYDKENKKELLQGLEELLKKPLGRQKTRVN